MVDTFVLTILARPMKIDGIDYLLAWDSAKNHVVIEYVGEDGELHDLVTDAGELLTFPRELDAHRYLVGLKHETDGPGDDSWRDL